MKMIVLMTTQYQTHSTNLNSTSLMRVAWYKCNNNNNNKIWELAQIWSSPRSSESWNCKVKKIKMLSTWVRPDRYKGKSSQQRSRGSTQQTVMRVAAMMTLTWSRAIMIESKRCMKINWRNKYSKLLPLMHRLARLNESLPKKQCYFAKKASCLGLL